jgi:CDGSH-type Zn-finger protein
MDAANVLRVRPDGPNVVTGEIVVVTPTGVREMKTAVLCRCGYSADKPFCDGAHVKRRFVDSARLPATIDTVAAADGGKLTITPSPNGPNRCVGPLTVRDVDGRTANSASTFLCRCGGSQTKPYCDGSHKKNGFRS